MFKTLFSFLWKSISGKRRKKRRAIKNLHYLYIKIIVAYDTLELGGPTLAEATLSCWLTPAIRASSFFFRSYIRTRALFASGQLDCATITRTLLNFASRGKRVRCSGRNSRTCSARQSGLLGSLRNTWSDRS